MIFNVLFSWKMVCVQFVHHCVVLVTSIRKSQMAMFSAFPLCFSTMKIDSRPNWQIWFLKEN